MQGNRFTRAVSVVLALVLIAALVGSAASCARKGETSEKIVMVVTILPLSNFVENVGGERVDISVMVPPGASPHAYEPTPSQMAALARAKIYAKVGSGIDFELVWMDKLVATNKKMLVVDCSSGVQFTEMTSGRTHEGEEHERVPINPHIWISPLNVKIIVQNICDGLTQVDPDNRVYFEHNRDAYLQELTQLDHDIRNDLSKVTNRSFMVYHPAWGYFAKDYNLSMLPVQAEGKEPTAAGIVHLIEQAKEYKIKVIFASPEFNPESAKVIAEAIGGRIVFIDPLAKDYISNLRRVLGEMVQAME